MILLITPHFFDSTYTLQFVDEFVYELGVCTDNLEAWKNIDALALTKTEWDHVETFCSLLHVCIEYVASE